LIKLTDILLETLTEKKLCPKGKAYYNRRIAAGEKPSAYLSGRAVKVCKGLMKENEEEAWNVAYDQHKDMLKTFVEHVLGIPYDKASINFGHSDGEDDDGIYINSKIYGENPILFSTIHKDSDGDLIHYEYDPYKPLNMSPEEVEDIINKFKLNKLGLNEEIDPSEAYSDMNALKTVVDGKRKIAFIVRKSNTQKNWQIIQDVIKETNLKSVYVKGNPYDAYIVYRPEGERDAMELKKLAEKYGGYLAANATEEDTRRIGQLLGYKADKIEQYIKDRNLGESLRDWFKKEDWVRIDTQGNITGPCGTMKKGKATTRCLPRAKANRLTKAERAATARKKVAGSKKGQQFVPNTPKAKVKFRK